VDAENGRPDDGVALVDASRAGDGSDALDVLKQPGRDQVGLLGNTTGEADLAALRLWG
jgi:hypothetical protein